jgi:hypothetical protein
VKVPVNPPCAHPHPPCCSISWTLYVPDGTSLKVCMISPGGAVQCSAC